MLEAGDRAPSFRLPDIDSAEIVTQPWAEGPVVVAFFKVTCPVCQMAAPMVDAMARSGCRVVAVGEDPVPALLTYRERFGQVVPTVSEPPPYRVSDAYGVRAVPSIFLVGPDAMVIDSAGSWDRDRWNAISVAAGGSAVSAAGDGLPPFRPG